MILNRIKEYIDFKDISISAFEKSIGMSNASFGKSLKNNGAIGTDKLENILNVYPDISLEWLLTGKGEMIKNSSLDKLEDPPFVPYDIYRDCLDHVKELMNMLKQSQKQTDDLIELLKEKHKTDKGNDARPDNDARCADAG